MCMSMGANCKYKACEREFTEVSTKVRVIPEIREYAGILSYGILGGRLTSETAVMTKAAKRMSSVVRDGIASRRGR